MPFGKSPPILQPTFIAGGTNLIDLMKYDVARPMRLIDITHLALKTVEETGLAATSQYGVDRRQLDATNALLLFL
jgi:hypothetical protein